MTELNVENYCTCNENYCYYNICTCNELNVKNYCNVCTCNCLEQTFTVLFVGDERECTCKISSTYNITVRDE